MTQGSPGLGGDRDVIRIIKQYKITLDHSQQEERRFVDHIKKVKPIKRTKDTELFPLCTSIIMVIGGYIPFDKELYNE